MTFGALFTQVLGFFDKRFQVTYFLPSLLFWGLLVVLWFAGQGNVAAAAELWKDGLGVGSIVRLIGFFAWLALFANFLASQSMGLLRLYEGYWEFRGTGPLRKLGEDWHRHRLQELGALVEKDPRKYTKEYQQIYFGYPMPGDANQVMATKLGNILKNAELYPYTRYEIDAVVVWPRLYNLISPTVAGPMVELRSGLDFMLVISSLSLSFALISGVYLIVVGASPLLFLLCFVGGVVIAWIAYRGAISNAVLYAEQIKVAFDLYRNDLLKQMRVSPPKSPEDEMKTWKALRQFLYHGDPSGVIYSSDGSAPEAKPPNPAFSPN